jgi:hypothetical protein
VRFGSNASPVSVIVMDEPKYSGKATYIMFGRQDMVVAAVPLNNEVDALEVSLCVLAC